MKTDKIKKFLIVPLVLSVLIVLALKAVGKDSIWYASLIALLALLLGTSLLILGYFQIAGKVNNMAVLMLLGIKKLPRPVSIFIGSVQIAVGLAFLLGMAKILMKML